eukprot:TRINITY_DN3694_c0_g1_i3.p1 TRINITY_DN3694_c0_g1~~TRINITY_DN3694_c0_g1_i3.p1  ORF type:complete len:440 (+),score=68.74 TRINITY_DN3694_c0_g1_i3:70-1389(+)
MKSFHILQDLLCDPHGPRKCVKVIGFVALWWSSAVVVSLMCKQTLGHGSRTTALFPFGIALTTLTNLSASGMMAVLSTCLKYSKPQRKSMTRREVLQVMVIGTIQGVSISLTNKALQYLDLSVRTSLMSMYVLFTMLSARFWKLEPLGSLRICAALLITVGGSMESVTEFARQPGRKEVPLVSAYRRHVAISMVFAAMLVGAQQWALTQYIMQRSAEGSALASMSKIEISSRILLMSSTSCFFLSHVFEPDAWNIAHVFQLGLLRNVLLISVGIATLSVAELETIKLTSAVTLQVLGTLHQIPILIIGALFFHEHIRSVTVTGFAICVAGAWVYVLARWQDNKAKYGVVGEKEAAQSCSEDEQARGGLKVETMTELSSPKSPKDCILGHIEASAVFSLDSPSMRTRADHEKATVGAACTGSGTPPANTIDEMKTRVFLP